MPLIDTATLVVGAANYFTAPVGTAAPADPLAPEVAWENVGHTSLEDILGFESEGGDATVLGTLQNPSLRTSYSKRTESFTINLQQFDEDSQKLYYGSNATIANGMLQVPVDPKPTQAAFLAVFVDKDNAFVIYVPKSEIFRADNIEISDTESLVSLPIKVTPLQHSTNGYTYSTSVLPTV